MALQSGILAALSLAIAPIDVHMHYLGNLLPHLNVDHALRTELDAVGIERAVVLSDAYLRPFGKVARDPRYPDARYEEDAKVSELAERSAGRVIGYCGVNLAWPDRRQVLETCLRLPYMRGVKVHTKWEKQTLTDPAIFAAFDDTLAIVEAVGGGMLIHADFGRVDPILEASLLRKGALGHPRATIVISHAAEYWPEALTYLGQSLRNEPSRNLFTEISTVFNVPAMFKDNPEKVVASWREFGMDWILFGSDGPIVGRPKHTRADLLASPLEPDEIEGILFRNGREFLRRISEN